MVPLSETPLEESCFLRLPGAAVSQVKIDGVLHEFSSIAGVKEDVTEIIMNVKSLSDQEQQRYQRAERLLISSLRAKALITAADIQADAGY